MTRYRVTIRGQKGDYTREYEADTIEFRASWWAVLVRYSYPGGSFGLRRFTNDIAAFPAENVNLIEVLNPPELL
jgi:hypothetical protein